MIIVKIFGGLGNQLFQYSFGRYLSGKFNTELKFDIQTNYTSSGFTRRSVGLGNFNINLNLATKKEIYDFKYFNIEFIARIERKLVQKLPFLNKRYIVQKLNKNKINDQDFKNDCYYDGYWQSVNYFESIEDIIRKDLELKFPLDRNIQFLSDDINANESISIHVRRGDYITIKKNFKRFAICSKEYYEHAIQYVKRKIVDPTFYIFSDDLEWAKENFVGSQYIFISGNNPAEDLYLMSNCKHNIIANSTFSWWGAWLNSNPLKIVIAPKNWYNGYLNEVANDLVPPAWIRI